LKSFGTPAAIASPGSTTVNRWHRKTVFNQRVLVWWLTGTG